MFYNTESDAFEYLADNKNIPFTYLETVSRKLGNSFHCTSKIIDRRNVQHKKKSKISTELSNVSNENVKAKANKFIYIGKFSSINPLQTSRYDNASPSKKYIRSTFSYKEYMESMKK